MPADTVRVRGMRELSQAFARADRDTRLGLRKAFREVGRPVAEDAEQLARANISHIGEKWPRMRVGVTQKLVYVAPRQRGIRTRGADPRKRPNLATLLMEKAMEPALERNAPTIERRVEAALDEVADKFNRGGAV
jgi:hypothetical protein